MLQLVLGTAGTGKTTWLLDAMDKRCALGGRSIYLVPEQFSSSAESLVYRRLGDAKSGLVQVLSFRTLGERILRQCGGGTLRVLSDAGRVVFARRALDALGGQLRAFVRQRRSTAFCSLCAHTFAELKTAGATPGLLREIALADEDEKLEELALVFEAYEALLAGSAMDPEDKLMLAAQNAGCGFLDDIACFVDSFDGFTAPEYALAEALLAHCDIVAVALCTDGLTEPPLGPDLFTPVRRAAQRLGRLAAKAGQLQAPPVLLAQNRRVGPPLLAAVGRAAMGVPLPAAATGGEEAVWLTEAADEWEELRLAAAEMHRLALEGMPYSKMALVCRSTEAYESAVRHEMELYGIPCFMDVPQTVEHTAPVAFLRAALALLQRGLSSNEILALIKTELCGTNSNEVTALENYVFTWQPKAGEWRTAFEKHPDGLMQEMTDTAQRQLEAAERMRRAVVPKIEKFNGAAKGRNGRELSKKLYLLMDSFGAAENAEAMAAALEARGELDYAQRTRRAWDMAMELLDQMALLLGDEVVSAAEYDELFLLLVRSTDFGQTPQGLECAVFTGADRMRLAEPEACFVLGLCEGEFPMQVGYSGLLTHADRDRLVAGGIELPGSYENRTLLERMFFYRALCAPKSRLYLSWPRRRAGEAKTMAAALGPVCGQAALPPLQAGTLKLAATPAAAYDLLAATYREDSHLQASLQKALQSTGDGMSRALQLLQAVDNPGLYTVPSPEPLRAILGEEMRLSATTAERYFHCAFSYYMERVLKLHQNRKAEISPLESGSFVHYVLEQVLRSVGKAFAHTDDATLAQLARQHAGAFIESNGLDADRRSAWRLQQVTESCCRLLCYMRDAAAQSRFAVDALELEIGDGPDAVPPMQLQTPQGNHLRLVGKIDRVDTWQAKGKTYLCIIDYKTGEKKLRLDEVYCGLNMQMMLYMAALCENAQEKYPNAAPAGVLYLAGDPPPPSGGRQQEEAQPYHFDGLLLADPEVLQAMDDHSLGGFLPVRFTKDGTPYKSSPVAAPDTFEAIQAHVKGLLGTMADGVYGGAFAARPQVKGDNRPCQWCPYRAACRHEDGVNELPVQAPENAFVPAGSEEVDGNG